MGRDPTPVPSLAAGFVPRLAPASVAVPSPVVAPAVAAPLPQPGSLLSLMRARATSAADRLGEVAGAAVSNRPVRASTISGESARQLTAKGRVTFSKRDHAYSEAPVQRAPAPAPAPDIVTGEPLSPWASEFVVARAGLEFVITDWVDAAPNKRSVADASVVKLDDTGRPSFAVKDRATVGLVDVVPIAAGLPMADLKTLRVSGTHPYWHFAGEVSELLGWPEKEVNILGDWTTSTAYADGSFKPGARAPKGSAGTCKKWYAVEASCAQQIRARTRFVQAVAAGYELFGLDNLTWSTSWLNIFPQPAPPELEAFYGPDKNPPKYRVPKRANPALLVTAGSSSPAPGSAPSAKRARTMLAITMKPSPATSSAALGGSRPWPARPLVAHLLRCAPTRGWALRRAAVRP